MLQLKKNTFQFCEHISHRLQTFFSETVPKNLHFVCLRIVFRNFRHSKDQDCKEETSKATELNWRTGNVKFLHSQLEEVASVPIVKGLIYSNVSHYKVYRRIICILWYELRRLKRGLFVVSSRRVTSSLFSSTNFLAWHHCVIRDGKNQKSNLMVILWI